MTALQEDLRLTYDTLLQEVEFECTFCEAVQKDIQELSQTIRVLYQKVVERSKTAETSSIRIAVWQAGYFIADDILQAACWKKNSHQICGVDSSVIEEFHHAIKERLELLTGLTLHACN
jgi:hypothetical protein